MADDQRLSTTEHSEQCQHLVDIEMRSSPTVQLRVRMGCVFDPTIQTNISAVCRVVRLSAAGIHARGGVGAALRWHRRSD